MFTYILTLFFAVLIPFVFSFERKVHYVQYWRCLFPALLLVGSIMLVWDYYFTGGDRNTEMKLKAERAYAAAL